MCPVLLALLQPEELHFSWHSTGCTTKRSYISHPKSCSISMQCETIVVYVTPSLWGPEEWCCYIYLYIYIDISCTPVEKKKKDTTWEVSSLWTGFIILKEPTSGLVMWGTYGPRCLLLMRWSTFSECWKLISLIEELVLLRADHIHTFIRQEVTGFVKLLKETKFRKLEQVT